MERITFVTMTNGSVYYQSQIELDSDTEFFTRKWYDQVTALNGKKYVFGMTDIERYSNNSDLSILSLAIGLHDPDAVQGFSLLGIMRIDANIGILKESLNRGEQKSSVNDQLIILDSNNNFIIDSQKDSVTEQTLPEHILKEVSSLNNGHVYKEIKEEKFLFIINTSDYSGCKVIRKLRLRDLLHDAVEVRKFTILIGFLSIIIVIISSIFVSTWITKPIRQLQQHIKTVETGILHESRMGKPKDELGELQYSFNTMVNELRALQAQVTPHFLYNTLEMIDGMAEESRVRDISTTVRNLNKHWTAFASEKLVR